jgi:hypothetical protein
VDTTANTDFAAVSAVCALLSRLTVPYWIAGGSENLLLPAEVFLAEADGRITCHRGGIPFLAPEVVLLFKARSKTDKDQHDVETALPVLDAGQRSWLQETLKRLPQGRTAAVPRR